MSYHLKTVSGNAYLDGTDFFQIDEITGKLSISRDIDLEVVGSKAIFEIIATYSVGRIPHY